MTDMWERFGGRDLHAGAFCAVLGLSRAAQRGLHWAAFGTRGRDWFRAARPAFPGASTATCTAGVQARFRAGAAGATARQAGLSKPLLAAAPSSRHAGALSCCRAARLSRKMRACCWCARRGGGVSLGASHGRRAAPAPVSCRVSPRTHARGPGRVRSAERDRRTRTRARAVHARISTGRRKRGACCHLLGAGQRSRAILPLVGSTAQVVPVFSVVLHKRLRTAVKGTDFGRVLL